MKIQIMSDVHLEHRYRLLNVDTSLPIDTLRKYFRNEKLTHEALIAAKTQLLDELSISPEADVLVLAGDICSADVSYKVFNSVGWFKQSKVPIVYVMGNHEHYGSNFYKTLSGLKNFFDDNSKAPVHILDNDYVFINGITFVGATFWSDISRIMSRGDVDQWSDFNYIKKFTSKRYLHEHRRAYIFIESMLAYQKDFDSLSSTVVVTHHVPTYETLKGTRFQSHPDNAFFRTDMYKILYSYIAPPLWICGHTHDSSDVKIGETRVVCNPFGYPGEQSGFTKHKIVKI